MDLGAGAGRGGRRPARAAADVGDADRPPARPPAAPGATGRRASPSSWSRSSSATRWRPRRRRRGPSRRGRPRLRRTHSRRRRPSERIGRARASTGAEAVDQRRSSWTGLASCSRPGRPRRTRRGHRCSAACTCSREAKACRRSAGACSSPGVCGPAQQEQGDQRPLVALSRPSTSSSTCRCFGVRGAVRPTDGHQAADLEGWSRYAAAGSSKASTGSRPDVWLQAVRTRVERHRVDAGNMRSFSSRLPITRCSTAVRTSSSGHGDQPTNARRRLDNVLRIVGPMARFV